MGSLNTAARAVGTAAGGILNLTLGIVVIYVWLSFIPMVARTGGLGLSVYTVGGAWAAGRIYENFKIVT